MLYICAQKTRMKKTSRNENVSVKWRSLTNQINTHICTQIKHLRLVHYVDIFESILSFLFAMRKILVWFQKICFLPLWNVFVVDDRKKIWHQNKYAWSDCCFDAPIHNPLSSGKKLSIVLPNYFKLNLFIFVAFASFSFTFRQYKIECALDDWLNVKNTYARIHLCVEKCILMRITTMPNTH